MPFLPYLSRRFSIGGIIDRAFDEHERSCENACWRISVRSSSVFPLMTAASRGRNDHVVDKCGPSRQGVNGNVVTCFRIVYVGFTCLCACDEKTPRLSTFMPLALLPEAPASTKTFPCRVAMSALKILPVGIDPAKSFVPEMAMPSGLNCVKAGFY